MASIAKDPHGRKRILFMAGESRKTIRLGKCGIKQAEAFKFKLEALIAARFTESMDRETAQWIADLPDDAHAKLAGAGLVAPRAATVNTTLGLFLDSYLKSRTDLKPNSLTVYGHTRRTLIEFFDYEKPLRQINSDDAKAWRAYLTEQNLSEATVNKRCGNAKVFFNVAVKLKLVASNPFSELDSKSIANKSRQHFIERKDADKILDACPDAQWRLIFSLCRYGGLRCPSEVLALRWSDVNWEQQKIIIHSPKTERYEGRESRIIPIFPEIMPYLEQVFESHTESVLELEWSEPGKEPVITRYRQTNVNLWTQLQRIIKRAGLKSWPRLFQNLRASRETELASEYPLHVATAWISNTARIAERHYLQIPDAYYERAVKLPDRIEKAAQNAAQHPAANSSKVIQRKT